MVAVVGCGDWGKTGWARMGTDTKSRVVPIPIPVLEILPILPKSHIGEYASPCADPIHHVTR